MTGLDERLPSHERLYAIKISGRFSRLQTRSVPAQAPPYVPLAEALGAQVVFPLQNVDATMVGFWLPDVMQLVNAAGFHFHALTTDLSFGGHVLDCEVASATVEIDETSESRIVF
jgi:acetolactate decarboxylase